MAESARNPDVLQQEIERTRDELARTIDVVAERVSPRNVVRRGAQQAKDTTDSLRRRLSAGGSDGSGDFHGELAERESERRSRAGGAGEAGYAAMRMLRENRGYVAAGVGVLLVVTVLVWRRGRS